MRKYLIAAHGSFSSGIKSSIDMIIGQVDHVFVIDAYADGNKSIEENIKAMVAKLQTEDELIVFSDLLGGSVTNQILHHVRRENVHVVSGMNLPLLIDIMLADSDLPVSEVVENAIANAKEQIVYVNKLINKESSHD